MISAVQILSAGFLLTHGQESKIDTFFSSEKSWPGCLSHPHCEIRYIKERALRMACPLISYFRSRQQPSVSSDNRRYR